MNLAFPAKPVPPPPVRRVFHHLPWRWVNGLAVPAVVAGLARWGPPGEVAGHPLSAAAILVAWLPIVWRRVGAVMAALVATVPLAAAFTLLPLFIWPFTCLAWLTAAAALTDPALVRPPPLPWAAPTRFRPPRRGWWPWIQFGLAGATVLVLLRAPLAASCIQEVGHPAACRGESLMSGDDATIIMWLWVFLVGCCLLAFEGHVVLTAAGAVCLSAVALLFIASVGLLLLPLVAVAWMNVIAEAQAPRNR